MQSILVEIDELSKTIDAELKAQFDRYEAKAAVVGDHISTVKKANALLKVAATAEFVESIRSLESPVVVFTDHVDSCEELAKALKCPMIRGDTSHKARQKIVEDFQGGTLLSCVLTLGAASLGITLHRSNICVFNDLNWVPSTNAQAAARIQRIGQTRKCLAYYLSRTGIDAYITKSLTAKSREIDEVVADKKETVYAEVEAYLSSL
jgi:SNF2 family DNA or RNA helicase